MSCFEPWETKTRENEKRRRLPSRSRNRNLDASGKCSRRRRLRSRPLIQPEPAPALCRVTRQRRGRSVTGAACVAAAFPPDVHHHLGHPERECARPARQFESKDLRLPPRCPIQAPLGWAAESGQSWRGINPTPKARHWMHPPIRTGEARRRGPHLLARQAGSEGPRSRLAPHPSPRPRRITKELHCPILFRVLRGKGGVTDSASPTSTLVPQAPFGWERKAHVNP